MTSAAGWGWGHGGRSSRCGKTWGVGTRKGGRGGGGRCPEKGSESASPSSYPLPAPYPLWRPSAGLQVTAEHLEDGTPRSTRPGEVRERVGRGCGTREDDSGNGVGGATAPPLLLRRERPEARPAGKMVGFREGGGDRGGGRRRGGVPGTTASPPA